MIVGNNGSGKSFFAKKLAVIAGLPLVHLDIEFWRPNWEMPSKDEWKKRNKELISKEKWIIEGNVNHGDTMKLRFEASDLIIFLNINCLICLTSVIKRNGKKRSDTLQYCEEKFNKEFFRFCKGILNYSKTRKHTMISLHKKYPGKLFFIIDSRRKMNKLLRQWEDEKN